MPKWTQRTTVDYVRGWNDLLPQGAAWPREPETVLQSVITGLSIIWDTQVETLAALLLRTESDPRSTNVLLPDWERAYGLPDRCFPGSPTLAQRQSNLVGRITFLGAQSRAFFIAEAALLGQTVGIQEYSPYQCGISGVGDTTNIDPDGLGSYRWGLGQETIRFYWTARVSALTGSWAGGDSFCIFNRWKPAHTIVTIDYAPLQELRASRPWNSGYYALF